MRASGILMPIFSLPSKYGIGAFSKEAMEFVDQLSTAGQKYWQVLPLGPTSYGDSPYQSFSSFAGNPYFIDLDELYNEGLLTKDELPEHQNINSNDNRSIDYDLLYKTRYCTLRKAYKRFNKNQATFQQFKSENDYWLNGYSSFMAIKSYYQDQDFYQWDSKLLRREKEALEKLLESREEDLCFYDFLQFKFMEQWDKLHKYANSKGIQIIGDIPIYVALDSADCWNSPELFQLDNDLKPVAVAGCPPDPFAKTGQLWGNPLYQWEYHKSTNYEWWVKRIQHSFKLYDMVRIDHFRGFDEYYSIPYGDKTAEFGTWKKGPGIDLFHSLNKQLGKLNIIAEDLGFLTDSVIQLLKDSGYPGMKILQFAFDSREESDYIPHAYPKNCVVYTGTHDNDTITGWIKSIKKEDRRYALAYMGINKMKTDIHWDFIRLAMASVADIAIFPIQDCLGLGSEARINIPSTLGSNWRWRMLPNEFTPVMISALGQLTRLYGRRHHLPEESL
jgi:4-alpha-glucanotransferase